MREALSVSEECVCIYNCEVYFVFVSLSVMGRYFALRRVCMWGMVLWAFCIVVV